MGYGFIENECIYHSGFLLLIPHQHQSIHQSIHPSIHPSINRSIKSNPIQSNPIQSNPINQPINDNQFDFLIVSTLLKQTPWNTSIPLLSYSSVHALYPKLPFFTRNTFARSIWMHQLCSYCKYFSCLVVYSEIHVRLDGRIQYNAYVYIYIKIHIYIYGYIIYYTISCI